MIPGILAGTSLDFFQRSPNGGVRLNFRLISHLATVKNSDKKRVAKNLRIPQINTIPKSLCHSSFIWSIICHLSGNDANISRIWIIHIKIMQTTQTFVYFSRPRNILRVRVLSYAPQRAVATRDRDTLTAPRETLTLHGIICSHGINAVVVFCLAQGWIYRGFYLLLFNTVRIL